MKRYRMIVSHEVIIYAEDEKAARRSLFHNMKERTNVQCISIDEIPMPDKEKIGTTEHYYIDNRKAPRQ